MEKKTIFIAFLGNYEYDTRCTNLIKTLRENNYRVKGAAFEWRDPSVKTVKKNNFPIYKLNRRIRIFFYLKFFLLCTYRVLFERADIYFAEDIYTLPFTVIAAKLRSAKVFYDSRELYAHLAGLKDKPLLQKVLVKIEKRFITKTDAVIVTGVMDGEFLKKSYGDLHILLLRNLPLYKKNVGRADIRKEFGIPDEKKIILYQGAILHGRGLEPLFNALTELPDCHLVIFGSDDETGYYKDFSKKLNIDRRVTFAGRYPQEELMKYTSAADIGTALIENISISYYYALPNKLFEYIMAEIPVVVSNLPQMKNIIEEYGVGLAVDPGNAEETAEALKKLCEDKEFYEAAKRKCREASESLHWDKEAESLLHLLRQGF